MEIDVISLLLKRSEQQKERAIINKYTYKGSNIGLRDGSQFISFLNELREEDITIEGSINSTRESEPLFTMGSITPAFRTSGRTCYNVDITVHCTEDQIINFESRYKEIAKHRTINFSNQYLGQWDWNRELRNEVLSTVPRQENIFGREEIDRWNTLYTQGIVSADELRGIATTGSSISTGTITADQINAGAVRAFSLSADEDGYLHFRTPN
jgi:hypothetical protein